MCVSAHTLPDTASPLSGGRRISRRPAEGAIAIRPLTREPAGEVRVAAVAGIASVLDLERGHLSRGMSGAQISSIVFTVMILSFMVPVTATMRRLKNSRW